MQWTKPGHQFDDEAEKIINCFNSHGKKIYLYGAGILGALYYPSLKKYGCFGGFIDIQEEKQQEGFLGEKVYSLQEFFQEDEKGIVVVSTAGKYWEDIEKEFQRSGLIHKKDYFFCNEMFNYYMPIFALYYYESSFMSLCQISLTERCTLRCEKCAHGCYNVPIHAQDLSWEDFCFTVEIFFEKVDYITEFVLIGGEPLLYERLADAIHYIGDRYRDRIGTLSITTNGTIVPGEEVLRESRHYDVLYRISNYSKEIPNLEKQHKKLLTALNDSQIRWRMAEPDSFWLDYGFETVNHSWDDDQMSEFFDKCATTCHEIRKNRFYYCVMARSVSENLGIHVGSDDFLDFSSLGEGDKKILLEYSLGFNKKGYLDMCRHCNGGQNINTIKIPVARQKTEKK